MINIKRKEDCVGCFACLNRCPKQCIKMYADEQGFLYPKVNIDECINCHLCEKVCPVINQQDSYLPIQTIAAKNINKNVQINSTSGGVFFELGKYIIENGGIVFGARFDSDWKVIHDYTESVSGLRLFQGSKYLQSQIGQTYKEAEDFLKSGKLVLFSGTPCQISGLKRYLGRDYGHQLLTVDFVCHGVPSPLVWEQYLEFIARPTGAPFGKNTVFQSLNVIPSIEGISFRDKRLGWEKYGFSIRYSVTEGSGQNSVFQSVVSQKKEIYSAYEPFNENIYMRMFLNDLDLRPSCYQCPAKCGKSHSDIILADYWGIKRKHPIFYDKDGVSLVMINSERGLEVFDAINLMKEPSDYNYAIRVNPAIVKSAIKPNLYKEFWNQINNIGFEGAIKVLNKIRPNNHRSLFNVLRSLCPQRIKSMIGRLLK